MVIGKIKRRDDVVDFIFFLMGKGENEKDKSVMKTKRRHSRVIKGSQKAIKVDGSFKEKEHFVTRME